MSEAVQPQDTHGAPFSARCGSTEIRPILREDAGALFPQIHGQPGVIRWLSWEGPARVEELEARYAAWRAGPADGPAYMFAVVDSGSGAVIGEASLRFDDHPGVGELGYWLGEDHHGCGHGRATVELLTRAGFERLGAFALTARVKEGNEASIAVLTAAGFDPVRAPRVPGDPEDPPIAWIFSTTRRGDARRPERPAVAFSMPNSG